MSAERNDRSLPEGDVTGEFRAESEEQDPSPPTNPPRRPSKPAPRKPAKPVDAEDTGLTSSPRDETCAYQVRPAPVDPASMNEPTSEMTGEYHADPADRPSPFRGDETCDNPPEPSAGQGTAAFVLPGTQHPAGGAPTLRRDDAGPHTQAPLGGTRTPKPPPARTGRYDLKKFHAKGGMGEIWVADDGDIGRSVALKKMRPGRQSQRDQFVREARVTGQLEHPGVVPVHEIGLDDEGQPFYVMKFVHGKTLGDVVEEYHKAGPDAAVSKEVQRLRLLDTFVDLCQTVAYAHSREVLHRDLKPDNVMVGPFGETLILDWGLAKVMGQPDALEGDESTGRIRDSGDTMDTIAGTIKGTPSYMAPEMATGDVGTVDQASDIFLLGGILYHMLTGKSPRESSKLTELLKLARTKAPDPPRKLDPSIPKPLDAICQKALAFRKQDRYQSAIALAEDVQRYLAGDPVEAYRENLLERTWRWVRKHQKGLGRAAAALLVLGTALTAFFIVKEANRRRAEAIQEFADLSRKDTARQEVNRFRNLAEEARFFAANADPSEENAPFFDPKKGEAKAQDALAVAKAWGPALEDFPLDATLRSDLKQELYDLLVLTAQVKTRTGDEAEGRAALSLLDQAATLAPPTRGLHRLRAQGHTLAKETAKAEAEDKQANDPKAPRRALDHFLQGEKHRAEASRLTFEKDKDQKDKDKKSKDPKVLVLEQAIDEYREALKIDPDDYWSHYQLGRTYLALGRGLQAVERLSTCVALKPAMPWSYSARGFALSRLKLFPDALADMDQALKLDREFRPARLNWAVARLQQKKEAGDKDLTDVLGALDELLAPPDDKKFVEAAFVRGQIYLENRDFDNALADFDLLLARKMDYRFIHLNRARVFLAQGDADNLLKSLTAYLAAGQPLDPESAQAFELRGKELRSLAVEVGGKLRTATYRLGLGQLQKAVELGGKTATLFQELGATHEKLRETEKAIAAYDRALKIDPKNVKTLVLRGWAWEKLPTPDYEKGRGDFADAVKLNPRDSDAHAGLGYMEACLKLRPADARRQANLALLDGAGDYAVLSNTACIYATLAANEPARSREYQDLALDLLRRAVDQWKEGGRLGFDVILQIQGDTTFTPLHGRPEWGKLLERD